MRAKIGELAQGRHLNALVRASKQIARSETGEHEAWTTSSSHQSTLSFLVHFNSRVHMTGKACQVAWR